MVEETTPVKRSYKLLFIGRMFDGFASSAHSIIDFNTQTEKNKNWKGEEEK